MPAPQQSLSDVLAGGDWVKAEKFVGQTVTVLEYEIQQGRTPDGKDSEWPHITAIADGEEVVISGTKNMLRQLRALEKADINLPLDLRIVSFKTSYGGTGFGFEDPGA